MIYLIIMILSVFFVMVISQTTDSKINFLNRVFLILSFLTVSLPHALRYGIGTDYFYTYVPGFFKVGRGFDFYSEIGFTYLNKIVYFFTQDYRVLFFVCSIIIFIFIYKGIFDNSKNMPISIILIFITQFYFSSMNLLRQAIAMAMIFYGFKYLKDSKKMKYIIICLIAFLFHNSALLMVSLLFMYNMKLSRKTEILICFLLLFFTPVLGEIISFIITNYTKYGWYYNTGYATASVSIILVVTNIILFGLGLLYFPNNVHEDNEYRILHNINFITMCCIVVSPVIPLIFRIIKYFTTFQILFVPYLFSREKSGKNRLMLMTVVLGLLAVGTIYQIFILGGEEVYPYVSIFD